MKNNHKKTTVNAVRTSEGFIEITSLEFLDEMVGGLVDPQAVFCQLSHEDNSNSKKSFVTEGV